MGLLESKAGVIKWQLLNYAVTQMYGVWAKYIFQNGISCHKAPALLAPGRLGKARPSPTQQCLARAQHQCSVGDSFVLQITTIPAWLIHLLPLLVLSLWLSSCTNKETDAWKINLSKDLQIRSNRPLPKTWVFLHIFLRGCSPGSFVLARPLGITTVSLIAWQLPKWVVFCLMLS